MGSRLALVRDTLRRGIPWRGGSHALRDAVLAAILAGGIASSLTPPALAPQAQDFPPSSARAIPAGTLAIWQTTPAGLRLARVPNVPLTACPQGLATPRCSARGTVITIDAAVRYQRIAGFGGAFNERGWVALQSLPAQTRRSVLRALFDPRSGAGFSLARTPIGASDYALNAYSLDPHPGDVQMRHFSIAHDRRYLLPYIKSALRIAPRLTVWASPWSAPGWMKSNHAMTHGGHLLPRYEHAYALYFADYIRAYARAGVPIAAVSVQNEPTRAPKYPSMLMSATQMARFVGDDLGPLLHRLGLHTAIRINEGPSPAFWQYSSRVLANPRARPYVAGTDLHGYFDAAVDFSRLHAAFPALDIWQTEAMHLDYPHYDYADAPYWAAQIASDLQHWVSGWDFWNMVTDQTGLSSWGWRQDAVIVVNTTQHVVTYTPKFAALAQFSRFIRPGAQRIGLSGIPHGVAATAALDPDGRRVLVAVNTQATAVPFTLMAGSKQASLTLPARSIVTYIWR
jgi:glucosylceramidase